MTTTAAPTPWGIMTRHGIVVKREEWLANSAPGEMTSILRSLSFEYQAESGGGKCRGPVQVCCSYQMVGAQSGPTFILPRFLLDRIPCRIRLGRAAAPPGFIVGGLTLMPHQKILVDKLVETELTETRIRAGLGAVTLVAPTGEGKTFIAMGIAARLGMRFLYIVKNKTLKQQAISNFTQHLGPDGWQVAIINSALKLDGAEVEGFDMVVYDEVDVYCTPVFSQIFFATQRRVNIAMTATLARRDGFEAIVPQLCSGRGTIFMARDTPGATLPGDHFEKTAIVLKYYARPEFAETLRHTSTDEIFVHYMYQQFTLDLVRIDLIISRLVSLYLWRGPAGQRHTIYMFADEVATLERYKLEFDERVAKLAGDPAESMLFTGGNGAVTRNLYEKACREGYVLWATYSYAISGISISRATAAISINGRVAGWEQCIGRITRAGSDASIPRIFIDIVDAATCLARQVAGRMDVYHRKGFQVQIQKHYAPIK